MHAPRCLLSRRIDGYTDAHAHKRGRRPCPRRAPTHPGAQVPTRARNPVVTTNKMRDEPPNRSIFYQFIGRMHESDADTWKEERSWNGSMKSAVGEIISGAIEWAHVVM